jgi:uncharacterized protein with FMN-binding domain
LTSASGFLLSVLDHPSTVVDAGNETTGGVSITPTAPSTTSPAASDPATSASAASEPAAVPATTATTTPETVASTVPAAPQCTTYNGPTVTTKWGPVQVQASVAADGTICWSDAPVTPDSKRKSVQINDRAVPVLDARAVASQGTNFDGVSGATVTTNGYKQSLQAILDAVASGQVGA